MNFLRTFHKIVLLDMGVTNILKSSEPPGSSLAYYSGHLTLQPTTFCCY